MKNQKQKVRVERVKESSERSKLQNTPGEVLRTREFEKLLPSLSESREHPIPNPTQLSPNTDLISPEKKKREIFVRFLRFASFLLLLLHRRRESHLQKATRQTRTFFTCIQPCWTGNFQNRNKIVERR